MPSRPRLRSPLRPPPQGWVIPLALLALLLTNPALYLGELSSRTFSPDAIAYLAMARTFIEGGNQLFLEGWGHVDTGLVLPPLYPLLLAAGGAVSNDLMGVAEGISRGALLLTALPLFLLLRPRCGAAIAVAAIFVLQLNAFYFGSGFVPLTEALFTLLLATAALLLDRLLGRPSITTAALLGLICALLFLTRQIGLAFTLVTVPWLLLAILGRSTQGPRWRHLTVFATLFTLITGGYSLLLFQQTGQGPLTQSFSLGRYQVERPADPALATPPATSGYTALLLERQRQRRLLEDGSEMIGYVKVEGAAATGGGTMGIAGRLLNDPLGWLERLWGNLKSLRDAAGWPLFALFALSLVLPPLTRGGELPPLRRYLPAAALLGYLGAVALFTDAIPRYAQVALPLLMVAGVGEGARAFARLPMAATSTPLRLGGPIIALLLIAATLPGDYRQVPLQPRIAEAGIPVTAFRQVVQRGDPILSPQPLYGYLAGGTPRTLPSGSLEQVVTYARLTGAHWLLMVALDERAPHARGYLERDWYGDLGLAQRHPRLLEYRGTTGDAVLYRIRPE